MENEAAKQCIRNSGKAGIVKGPVLSQRDKLQDGKNWAKPFACDVAKCRTSQLDKDFLMPGFESPEKHQGEYEENSGDKDRKNEYPKWHGEQPDSSKRQFAWRQARKRESADWPPIPHSRFPIPCSQRSNLMPCANGNSSE